MSNELDEGLNRLRKGGVNSSPPEDATVPPNPPAQHPAHPFEPAPVEPRVADLEQRVDQFEHALSKWEQSHVALRDLEDALQAVCPSCDGWPVLRIRAGQFGPTLYFECPCKQQIIDGGTDVAAGLRVVGRTWLREHRGEENR